MIYLTKNKILLNEENDIAEVFLHRPSLKIVTESLNRFLNLNGYKSIDDKPVKFIEKVVLR